LRYLAEVEADANADTYADSVIDTNAAVALYVEQTPKANS